MILKIGYKANPKDEYTTWEYFDNIEDFKSQGFAYRDISELRSPEGSMVLVLKNQEYEDTTLVDGKFGCFLFIANRPNKPALYIYTNAYNSFLCNDNGHTIERI